MSGTTGKGLPPTLAEVQAVEGVGKSRIIDSPMPGVYVARNFIAGAQAGTPIADEFGRCRVVPLADSAKTVIRLLHRVETDANGNYIRTWTQTLTYSKIEAKLGKLDKDRGTEAYSRKSEKTKDSNN